MSVMAIAVGQEINQQLNQAAVRASCFEVVRRPGALFVAEKKAGSGELADMCDHVLARQTQNFC
ncbi:hypothetical protein [Mesorhizobium sp. ORM8.1]